VGIRALIAGAVTLAVLCLAVPSTAQEGGVPNPPWPQALPPDQIPLGPQPGPVRNCRRASIACVDLLARRLRRQWQRFDAGCDHRAVTAYSYLQITLGLRADLARRKPGLIRHRRYFTYLITAFSNRYFNAFRNWADGGPVAEGWRIAFETAAEGDANAGQDVLLFSNVHVQHDLPFVLEKIGLRAPNGASRKPDHDAVNEINARVFDPIQDYIAAHYDPTFDEIDAGPSPLDETGTLELVKSWREQAWRSAERLLAAESPQERRMVVDRIKSTTAAWARFISGGGTPGHREARDEWCRAH
jgi:hypothetical protein